MQIVCMDGQYQKLPVNTFKWVKQNKIIKI